MSKTAALRRVASLGLVFVAFWSLYPYIVPWGGNFTGPITDAFPITDALRYGAVAGLLTTVADFVGWWAFGVWTDVERRAARAALLALALEANGVFTIELIVSHTTFGERLSLLQSGPGIAIFLLFYLPAYGLVPAFDKFAWTFEKRSETAGDR